MAGAAAAVVAIATGDTTPAKEAKPLKVEGINQKIAGLLGTSADQVLISDMIVNPISRNAYLAVSRGRGTNAVPVLMRVNTGDELEVVSLDKVKFSRGELPDAPVEGVVPTSYVPFRNAHLLAAATSWAEVLGATTIFVGAVWEDSSGYPDCRPEFYRAYEEAIRLGTRPETHIRIATPVIGMSKADIVRKGLELGAPFADTWSCYQDEEAACGVCESCRLRLRGFREAGFRRPCVATTPC